MKIELIHVSRRLGWPPWAILIVLLWSGLGIGVLLLGAHFDRPVQLCLLKHITGVACPTCGFTRGVLSLLHGHIAQTWLYNPLLFSVLALFVIVVVFRAVFALAVRVSLTKTERAILWAAALILFFANWTYVILYVG